MPVSDSEGNYGDDEFEYHHKQLFGEGYNQQTDTYENPKTFLVRHGDTKLNDEDLIHGWVNEPLNEKGIEQAHKDAKSLKDQDITQIVSSDLPRAKQTANIISKTTGAPVSFHPGLRTWDSGDFDYTNKHEEFEKYTKENKANEAPSGSNESFNDFKARAINTIGDIHNSSQGNTVIVTHSKPIAAVQAWAHAGYPEDGSIHLGEYEKIRCKEHTGELEQLELPASIAAQRIRQSVKPEEGRQEGPITDWLVGQGEKFKDYVEGVGNDISQQGLGMWWANNMVGPGMVKGPKGLSIPIKGQRPMGWWNEEGKSLIKTRLDEGSTIQAIADEFGVKESNIRSVMKKHGLKSNDLRGENTRQSDEYVERLNQLLEDPEHRFTVDHGRSKAGDVNWSKIARTLGVKSPTGVKALATRRGNYNIPDWLQQELRE